VSSLVVVPLGSDGLDAFGGIYFALDTPDDFTTLQAPILGVVSMVAVLLQRKLEGRAEALQEQLARGLAGSPHASVANSVESPRHVSTESDATTTLARLASGGTASSAGSALCTDSIMRVRAGGWLAGSWLDAWLVDKSGSGSAPFDLLYKHLPSTVTRTCILNTLTHPPAPRNNHPTHQRPQAVQRKLATSHSGIHPRRQHVIEGAQRYMEDLVLEEVMGRGGFGLCYRARFRGLTVAVKVRLGELGSF
jgi:hypothetical protein